MSSLRRIPNCLGASGCSDAIAGDASGLILAGKVVTVLDCGIEDLLEVVEA